MDPTWPERPATEPTTPPAEPDATTSPPAPEDDALAAAPAPVQAMTPWPGIAPAVPQHDVPAGSDWELAKPRRRGRLPLSIAIATLMVVTFFSGVAVDRTVGGAGATPPATGVSTGNASEPPEFKTFWEAWDVLHQHYVDQSALDPTKLTYGATSGMVDAIGDTGHTRFLTPDQVTASHQNLSGFDHRGSGPACRRSVPRSSSSRSCRVRRPRRPASGRATPSSRSTGSRSTARPSTRSSPASAATPARR